MRKISAVPAVVAAAVAVALPAGPAQAVPERQVTVYVDPPASAALGGGQNRDGSTPERAVSSVAEAESVLRAAGARDARVLLRGGVHHLTSTIRWGYAPRGGTVTFSTIPGTGAVVLDGSRMRPVVGSTSATGDDVGAAAAEYGMTLTSADGGVVVYYLANDDSPAAIHGVYLANYTNSSTLSGNRFGYVTGDPIRTRHNSKNNVADGNMFWRAGAYAIISDWRFGSEDCGVGNVFKNNKVGDHSYNGDAWNEDPQGGIDPVRVRLWGHDDATNANLGGCASDPVTFGGGNTYVSSRPW